MHVAPSATSLRAPATPAWSEVWSSSVVDVTLESTLLISETATSSALEPDGPKSERSPVWGNRPPIFRPVSDVPPPVLPPPLVVLLLLLSSLPQAARPMAKPATNRAQR